MKNTYIAISFYKFFSIENPEAEVKAHKRFIKNHDIYSRIYISHEGINGQLSASESDGQAYMEWVKQRPGYEEIEFKVQTVDEQVFPKKTVKVRKELVALGKSVDFSKKGEYVTPQEWKRMLDEGEALVLDIRNDYEWEVGHFEGAECPPCKDFRDFIPYVQELKERVDAAKKPIMMSCTGGIRCEVMSALMKEEGFDKIYQLQGGVIKYGQEVGSDHWKGKLFVFDDRMTIPLDKGESEPIGKCHLCEATSEAYFNCANMNCNKLFLCCPDCLEKHQGCCGETCQESPRCRPINEQHPHKPFRKWYNYAKSKEELNHLKR